MPKDLVSIRIVTQADLKQLLELSIKTFHDAFAHLNKAEDMEIYLTQTFNEASFHAELTQPGSSFYFAEAEGQIAGYMKLNTGNTPTELPDNNSMEIQRLYILANYQGKKIGEQLINFAVSKAQKNNCTTLWLGVWEHNVNAVRFYERQGFTRFAQHDFLLGNDLQTDLLMKKPLL